MGLYSTLVFLHVLAALFWLASSSERMRRRSALLARADAVAGLVLVYWATRLARGG